MKCSAYRFTNLFLGLLALVVFLSTPAFGADEAPYRVALLPLVLHAGPDKAYLRPGLQSMLVSRLSGEGIELIRDDAVRPLLTESEKNGIAFRDRAEELAGTLGATHVIFGSVTSMGAAYSIDLSIIDLDKGKATQVTETAGEDELIAVIADVVYQFRAAVDGIDLRATRAARQPSGLFPEQQTTKGLFFKPDSEGIGVEPTGRVSLRMDLMAMDIADMDGDGASEMILVARDKAVVYQKTGQSFALRGTLKAPLGEVFLKVSVGDADRDGFQEIYLVGRYGERARTTIWKWDGKFKPLGKIPGHLVVLKEPIESRPKLFFQDTKSDDFFRGRIYRMEYDGNGKLTRKEPLEGLDKAQIYTLTLFDANGDGVSEFLALNDFSRLRLWDNDGTVLWRSDRKLGGTNNSIRHKQGHGGDLEALLQFNCRLILADIDKDGAKEVLAVSNTPLVDNLEHFKIYEKSRLVVYKVKGDALAPFMTSMTMRYCLTDIQTDGGMIYLAAQKGKYTKIGEGTSRIMWFE